MSSDWNHNICWQCWVPKNTAEDGQIRIPVRLVPGKTPGEPLTVFDIEQKCCFCGHLNIEGIMVRDNPLSIPCQGDH